MRGTIKSKVEMERLFREGRRSSSSLLTVIVAPSSSEVGRWAFIAGKKLGIAPLRSRCKRVMRAAAAGLDGPWPGFDAVFIARRRVATAKPEKIAKEMSRCLKEQGVFADGR